MKGRKKLCNFFQGCESFVSSNELWVDLLSEIGMLQIQTSSMPLLTITTKPLSLPSTKQKISLKMISLGALDQVVLLFGHVLGALMVTQGPLCPILTSMIYN